MEYMEIMKRRSVVISTTLSDKNGLRYENFSYATLWANEEKYNQMYHKELHYHLCILNTFTSGNVAQIDWYHHGGYLVAPTWEPYTHANYPLLGPWSAPLERLGRQLDEMRRKHARLMQRAPVDRRSQFELWYARDCTALLARPNYVRWRRAAENALNCSPAIHYARCELDYAHDPELLRHYCEYRAHRLLRGIPRVEDKSTSADTSSQNKVCTLGRQGIY